MPTDSVIKSLVGCPEFAFQYFRHSQIKCIVCSGKIKMESYVIGTKGKLKMVKNSISRDENASREYLASS
jgi:hypothetical protein